MRLTTHLHLLSRLRIIGTTPPLPQYVFMAWYYGRHRDKFALPYLYLLSAIVLEDRHIAMILGNVILKCILGKHCVKL
jgi:hypothetical protein